MSNIIAAMIPSSFQPDAASEEKLNSFRPTRIFAGGNFAMSLQEDGSIVYLYRKEGWDFSDFPDFKEYMCGTIIEDSDAPGIITQDLKERIHDITAEEFEALLADAAKRGEPVSEGVYSILEKIKLEEAWQDVQQMICYHGVWYAALKKDGRVVSLGIFSQYETIAEDWTEIVQIASDGNSLYGLKADGTVCVHPAASLQKQYVENLCTWQDIVQIAGGNTLFGLRKDGTVVSMKGLFSSECETWSNITYIAASRYALVGIREDGTLAAACRKESGFAAEDVTDWKDIESIAVCDEYCVAVGRDGTVYCTKSKP